MPANRPPAGYCLDLARAAASHYNGGNRLHGDPARAHEIFQASTISALLDAVYGGGESHGELEQHGDFGLGTFNQLDGETIALDGSFYHLHAGGSAAPVQPGELTPFAAVTFFRSEESDLHVELPETAEFMNAQLTGHGLNEEIGSPEGGSWGVRQKWRRVVPAGSCTGKRAGRWCPRGKTHLPRRATKDRSARVLEPAACWRIVREAARHSALAPTQEVLRCAGKQQPMSTPLGPR